LTGIRTWAGKTRQSAKNIGVSAEQIPTQLSSLFGDTRYWIEHKTFPWDGIGARFHHRLVQIHAFPNGNGRHARLMTDILVETHGQNRFSWGMSRSGSPIETEGSTREEYIQALREADKKSFGRLIRFVRS
jgi:Fic-DOC domain mobile mystery protein B